MSLKCGVNELQEINKRTVRKAAIRYVFGCTPEVLGDFNASYFKFCLEVLIREVYFFQTKLQVKPRHSKILLA